MTTIHRLLRVPDEPGAGRTYGRLTIADGRNSPGCPVVDSAVAHVERDGRVEHARGVVISPSPAGTPALTVAWRGAGDPHQLLRHLYRVPGLRRLVTMRGHLA